MSEKTEAQGYVGSVNESRIRFDFKREFLKFDGEKFCLNYCSALKGVDFLVVDEKRLVFLEVKNFRGDEEKNLWRTVPDNKYRTNDAEFGNVSLDHEIVGKVSGSLAALRGAQTFDETASRMISDRFRDWRDRTNDFLKPTSTTTSKVRLSVVLLLEGAAEAESNDFATVANRLERSLKKKLKWLNCLVYVVDLNGAVERPAISRLFDATLLPNA